jgi:hypothetical protein
MTYVNLHIRLRGCRGVVGDAAAFDVDEFHDFKNRGFLLSSLLCLFLQKILQLNHRLLDSFNAFISAFKRSQLVKLGLVFGNFFRNCFFFYSLFLNAFLQLFCLLLVFSFYIVNLSFKRLLTLITTFFKLVNNAISPFTLVLSELLSVFHDSIN